MTNAKKIIKMANDNNGYVTTKQVKKANINTIELTRLVEQNCLINDTLTITRDAKNVNDDKFTFLFVLKFIVFTIKKHRKIFSNTLKHDII